jgi:hypothetical protein
MHLELQFRRLTRTFKYSPNLSRNQIETFSHSATVIHSLPVHPDLAPLEDSLACPRL